MKPSTLSYLPGLSLLMVVLNSCSTNNSTPSFKAFESQRAATWLSDVSSSIVNISNIATSQNKKNAQFLSPKAERYASMLVVGKVKSLNIIVDQNKLRTLGAALPTGGCVTVSGDTSDTDGDGIPVDETLTYDCLYYSNTDDVSIIGQVNIRDNNDSDPDSGFKAFFNNLEYKYVHDPSQVWHYTETTYVEPGQASFNVTYTNILQDPTLKNADSNLTATFARTAGTIGYNQGLLSGGGDIRQDSAQGPYTVHVSTQDLLLDSSCINSYIKQGDVILTSNGTTNHLIFSDCVPQ